MIDHVTPLQAKAQYRLGAGLFYFTELNRLICMSVK